MRFPLALTAKIASHIIKHKLARTPKFALVLQLEPLHTCNLTCTGCGRIREYSTSLKDMMSLEDCLASARECDAPMVDRKSTRLNSSHSQISYAVFCLKKKKKEKQKK